MFVYGSCVLNETHSPVHSIRKFLDLITRQYRSALLCSWIANCRFFSFSRPLAVQSWDIIIIITIIITIIIIYSLMKTRDVTDSKSDKIRRFFQNPKSVGYLKSDRVGFEIFVSVQLYDYFHK